MKQYTTYTERPARATKRDGNDDLPSNRNLFVFDPIQECKLDGEILAGLISKTCGPKPCPEMYAMFTPLLFNKIFQFLQTFLLVLA